MLVAVVVVIVVGVVIGVLRKHIRNLQLVRVLAVNYDPPIVWYQSSTVTNNVCVPQVCGRMCRIGRRVGGVEGGGESDGSSLGR